MFQGTVGDAIPGEMLAVVTTNHGGYDKLAWRRVSVPELGSEDALLRVLAAGVNNTDINLRIGWYSKDVKGDTGTLAHASAPSNIGDGSWKGTSPFPIIQGADCCGRVVAVGRNADRSLIGRRSIVRSCMSLPSSATSDTVWLGSDLDGAFGEFVRVPAAQVFPVNVDWSDAELGAVPCVYGTAENMLLRADVRCGMTVLVAGASGGVGTAAVQLAKLRGARVVAIADASKRDQVRAAGADIVLDRSQSPATVLGEGSIDIAIDNVAGATFGEILRTLRAQGRYVTSGAIAGPIVQLDMRTLYLKDLMLIGCTAWEPAVFPNLISYIETNRFRPVIAQTWPLEQIADAQRAFLEKRHVGKLVLIPPVSDSGS